MTKTNNGHDQFAPQWHAGVMEQKKSSTHYVCILVDHARRIGLDVPHILEVTGIPPELASDRSQWIDNELLTRLVKTMWAETKDETFGLDPNPLKIGTWALACEFMLGADTLGELLRKGD